MHQGRRQQHGKVAAPRVAATESCWTHPPEGSVLLLQSLSVLCTFTMHSAHVHSARL